VSTGRIALFLDMMAAERGASPNTLEAYRRDLEDFSARLAAEDADLETARTEDLEAVLSALARDGLSASTAARRLSAARRFYRFLLKEGLRADDPATGLSGPKRARPLPKTLSEADVDRLFQAADPFVAPAECEAGVRVQALDVPRLFERLDRLLVPPLDPQCLASQVVNLSLVAFAVANLLEDVQGPAGESLPAIRLQRPPVVE